MNWLKKITLLVYVSAFVIKTLFALEVIESEYKAKIVIFAELVFWIALILDSVYNTK